MNSIGKQMIIFCVTSDGEIGMYHFVRNIRTQLCRGFCDCPPPHLVFDTL